MKKIMFYVMAAFVVMLAVACNKEEENDDVANNDYARRKCDYLYGRFRYDNH